MPEEFTKFMIKVASQLGGIEAEQKNTRKSLDNLSREVKAIKEAQIKHATEEEGEREHSQIFKTEFAAMKKKISDHGRDISEIRSSTIKLSPKNIQTWIRLIPYIILALGALSAFLEGKTEFFSRLLGGP